MEKISLERGKHPYLKVAGIVFLCLVFIMLVMISWKMLFLSYDGAVTVRIYQDGELLYTIPLHEVEEAYELTIETESGGKNVLLVSKDEISVAYADCPDQVCVKRGVVSYSEIPVICMPNKLVIEFEKEGEGEETDMA